LCCFHFSNHCEYDDIPDFPSSLPDELRYLSEAVI